MILAIVLTACGPFYRPFDHRRDALRWIAYMRASGRTEPIVLETL